jgi:phosphoglycolate phosphatase
MSRPWPLLVFDWDGTLMDSTPAIVRAAQAAIHDLGLPRRSDEEIREIIGLGLRESWQALFPELEADAYHGFVSSYRGHFLDRERASSRLYPGVREVLLVLRERGCRLAVATGKSRLGLDHDMAVTGLGDLFEATRTADETRSKPHPEMLFSLMADLGFGPEQTLMVGDTEFDLQMARSAGTAALALTWGAHPEARLRASSPAGCLHHVEQIPGWLDELEAEFAQGGRYPDQG